MANYSMNSHSLSFSDDYKTLKVSDSGGTVVETYELDAVTASVSVAVSGTNYVVAAAADFTSAKHEADVGAGDELSFNAAKMDGIGIVDIRDVNRTASDRQYDLACTTFRLKYVSGPFAVKIHYPDGKDNCVTLV